MIFCGQCGLQLRPGDMSCPRCGTVVEAEAPQGASYPNPATQAPAGSQIANNQQKLVLRPAVDSSRLDYGTQSPFDATSMMNANTMGTAYPGYTQNAGAYPQTGAAYSGGQTMHHANPPTMNTAYPSYTAAPGYQAPQATLYPPSQPTSSNRGRAAALAIILVGLLFILAAMILAVLQHNGTIGGHHPLTLLLTLPSFPFPSHQIT